MRLMSFAKTVPQFESQEKVLTHRDAWITLTEGEKLMGCSRLPRAGKGKWRRLHAIQVIATRWRRLADITEAEVALEGFPGKSPEWFIKFYCAPKPPDLNRWVHRIAFRHLEPRTAWVLTRNVHYEGTQVIGVEFTREAAIERLFRRGPPLQSDVWYEVELWKPAGAERESYDVWNTVLMQLEPPENSGELIRLGIV